MGALSSLSQLTLKATVPGIPDFYQGTEGWDLSLVDPDNRRTVDFAAHEAALASAHGISWSELAEHWTDGQIKIALTHRLFTLRNASAHLFTHGSYTPVEAIGPDRDHIIAFTRSTPKSCILVVVGRLFARVTANGEYWPTAGFQVQLQGLPSAPVTDLLGSGPLVRKGDIVEGRLRDIPLMSIQQPL
jgi:(1->4)-alpha-D-glucan 1-alpha-D-glucosylmutase